MRFLSTSNSLGWNTIDKKTFIECVGSPAEPREKKRNEYQKKKVLFIQKTNHTNTAAQGFTNKIIEGSR